ncbi:MAG: hypothetical protein IT522_11785 [Burkholderiales bacterium]|nr:hypothetical protein [Burkholderiales bacterium]
MFGFGKNDKDPLADARAAERWLAAFPANDPLATQSGLVTALGRAAEVDAPRTPQRLATIIHVDHGCTSLRKSLTQQYIEHATRSTKIEHQLWAALFDLTQAFLLAYYSYAREVSRHAQSTKWQQLLPELVCRQIVHMGLDARIRLYRYEPWIPAKWAELHDLFALACSRQIERHALPRGAGSTTIEHEYLLTLLLQLMHGGNMTARHLEWVATELESWAAPLRLALEPSSATSFYVDLGAREGLKRRTPGPLEGRVLFLDTRTLHSVLLQNVLMLEQKIKREPLSDRTPKRTEQLGLVARIAAQVDPEFKPFARRGERSATAGTADAILGFGKISAYLREEDTVPVPRLESGKSFGSTLELAVFGRIRNETDRRMELARRRFAQYSAPGGPWEIRDVSQTGYRLIAPMGTAGTMTLGTLAATRAHDHPGWTLGIIRRIKRMTADRAEIGMQIVANAMVAVELAELHKGSDAYSVNGETTAQGRRFHGLFLALRARDGDSEVQSLIVPPAEYQPGKRLHLTSARASNPIRFGRVLERQSDWVWAMVESGDATAPLPAVSDIVGVALPPSTEE